MDNIAWISHLQRKSLSARILCRRCAFFLSFFSVVRTYSWFIRWNASLDHSCTAFLWRLPITSVRCMSFSLITYISMSKKGTWYCNSFRTQAFGGELWSGGFQRPSFANSKSAWVNGLIPDIPIEKSSHSSSLTCTSTLGNCFESAHKHARVSIGWHVRRAALLRLRSGWFKYLL